MDQQCAGVRKLVLEARRRRPIQAGKSNVSSEWRISLSADGSARRFSRQARLMASPLRRLSLSLVQHEHGIVSNGYAGSVPLGKSSDDASISHIACDYRVTSGESREHFLSDVRSLRLLLLGLGLFSARDAGSNRRPHHFFRHRFGDLRIEHPGNDVILVEFAGRH